VTYYWENDFRYIWLVSRSPSHFLRLRLMVTSAAKSLHSCPTMCDPRDGLLPGSSVPGILQARTLEWVAISFSNAWKWKVKVKSLSRVRLLATSWTAAYQAPPSMGFSRQEYWSGVPSPSPTMGYSILKKIFFLTICFCFWLHWVFIAVWAFSAHGKQVFLCVAVHRLLVAVASPVVGHRL